LHSLPECHPYITASRLFAIFQKRSLAPLPRFFALQRFPSHAEPRTPQKIPCFWVSLHPQGFAPSRRFAPCATSRAYSIPVPLLGIYPSRSYSSRHAARSLKRRAPPWSCCLPSKQSPPGTSSSREAPPWTWSLAKFPRRIPPWAFPSLRFAVSCSPHVSLQRWLPSHAFSAWSYGHDRRHPRVFTAQDSAVLSRDQPTPLRFSTSLHLSTLWMLRKAGSWFPL